MNYHKYSNIGIFSIRGENMFKILFKVLKKFVLGMFLLFGYNAFLTSLNVIIPINIVTILISSLFDVPGVIGMVLFFLINF